MARLAEAEDWRAVRALRLRAPADAPEAFEMTLAQAEQGTDEDWRQRVPEATSASPSSRKTKTAISWEWPSASSTQMRGEEDRMAEFLFRLETGEGAPADPPRLKAAIPNWGQAK
jgi:hypothetical protein